jgi:hypothetical protein
MRVTINWPWAQLEEGAGFFVPCLDLARVREAGLRAAIPHKFNAKARYAIKGGLMGVWFYRPRPAST